MNVRGEGVQFANGLYIQDFNKNIQNFGANVKYGNDENTMFNELVNELSPSGQIADAFQKAIANKNTNQERKPEYSIQSRPASTADSDGNELST